jgi:dihydropteroate synthase
MGIVNRTPDSFFDGGQWLGDDAGRARALAVLRAGADVVDVGAESTRPGAAPVTATEQIERLGDVIALVVAEGGRASIDTTLPEVAEHALRQGATMINSVSLEPARELGELAARFGADLVLTHCRGAMTDMPGFSRYPADGYRDVCAEVAGEWQAAAARAMAAGVPRARLWFDPGLGFAKNAAQSLELCARLADLKQTLGHPMLVGPSRKSFVARAVAGEGEMPAPAERLGGSIAAALACARRGADMLRVHDVAETAQALAFDGSLATTTGGGECSRG